MRWPWSSWPPPDELAAVVGLPNQIAQRDAVAIQVALDTGGEQSAGRRAAALGEGPEQQPAADLAGGVLHQRQPPAPGLGPEVGNIVEILGLRGDLLEQPPGGFDRGQVLAPLLAQAQQLRQGVTMYPANSTNPGGLTRGELQC